MYTGPCHFSISAIFSPNTCTHTSMAVTVRSTDNDTFQGVLLQGRVMADDTTAAGTISSDDPNLRQSDCMPPEVSKEYHVRDTKIIWRNLKPFIKLLGKLRRQSLAHGAEGVYSRCISYRGLQVGCHLQNAK